MRSSPLPRISTIGAAPSRSPTSNHQHPERALILFRSSSQGYSVGFVRPRRAGVLLGITKPDHVGGVRQAIFDLAVRGRVAPQDPGDQPASGCLITSVSSTRTPPITTPVTHRQHTLHAPC